jgi:hypothetical protein
MDMHVYLYGRFTWVILNPQPLPPHEAITFWNPHFVGAARGRPVY